METLLAILATEAGVALVAAAITGVAAIIQTARQQGAAKAAKKAAEQADSALDSLGIVIIGLQHAHARALAAGDAKAAEEIMRTKKGIKAVAELGRVEREVIAPILDSIRSSVPEVAAIFNGTGQTEFAKSDALKAARAAREKWKAMQEQKAAPHTTSLMRGFGPLMLASPLLLASCASYEVLCPPRLTGEFVAPPTEEGEPIAVVLTLPEGAPGEIEWYILADHDDGSRTLTFPILFDLEDADDDGPEADD